MENLNALVKNYVEMWNEPDAEKRRRTIRELWTEDGAQYTKIHEPRGYAELEERVTNAHVKNVRDGGYIFRPKGDAEGHHNLVRVHWEMVPAKGGKVEALGQDLFLLDDAGKIEANWTFMEPTPV
jgi:hypothetical protein